MAAIKKRKVAPPQLLLPKSRPIRGTAASRGRGETLEASLLKNGGSKPWPAITTIAATIATQQQLLLFLLMPPPLEASAVLLYVLLRDITYKMIIAKGSFQSPTSIDECNILAIHHSQLANQLCTNECDAKRHIRAVCQPVCQQKKNHLQPSCMSVLDSSNSQSS